MKAKYRVKDLDYEEIDSNIINPLIIKELYECFRFLKGDLDIIKRMLIEQIEEKITHFQITCNESSLELSKSKEALKHFGLWDFERDWLKNEITAYYHPDYQYKKDFFNKVTEHKANETQSRYWNLILSEIMKRKELYIDALIKHIQKVENYNEEMEIRAIYVKLLYYTWQQHDGGFFGCVGTGLKLMPIDLKHNKIFCLDCSKWIELKDKSSSECPIFNCSDKHFCNPQRQSEYTDFCIVIDNTLNLRDLTVDLSELDKILGEKEDEGQIEENHNMELVDIIEEEDLP